MSIYCFLRYIQCNSRYFSVVVVVLGFMSSPGWAESPIKPFSTITPGLSILTNTNRETFHTFWTPAPGVEARIRSPFHYCDLEIGLQYLPFEAKSNEQPDLTGLYTYIRAVRSCHLSESLLLSLGGHTGIFTMDFEAGHGETGREYRIEREMASGLHADISWALTSDWRVTVSLNKTLIYTNKNIDLMCVSIGLCRSFSTPKTLLEFLE